MNIDDITGQLVQHMQQNNGLQPLANAQPITVGGIEGRFVMSQSPSSFPAANGQPPMEQDRLVIMLQRDGSVMFMVFVAPQAEFDRSSQHTTRCSRAYSSSNDFFHTVTRAERHIGLISASKVASRPTTLTDVGSKLPPISTAG